MKIRKGFVSNSSSSSFYILSKGELTNGLMAKLLGIIPGSLLYTEIIRGNPEKYYDSDDITSSAEDELGFHDDIPEIEQRIKEGWFVYYDSISDDGHDPLASLMGFEGKHILEDIIFYKPYAGY